MIDAGGTLDLDDKLQPQGTLTAKIRGYGAVIEDLQKAGVVKDRDAGFAKVGLDLMAGQPAARRHPHRHRPDHDREGQGLLRPAAGGEAAGDQVGTVTA